VPAIAGIVINQGYGSNVGSVETVISWTLIYGVAYVEFCISGHAAILLPLSSTSGSDPLLDKVSFIYSLYVLF